MKCIAKIQSHRETGILLTKVDIIDFYRKLHLKEEVKSKLYQNIPKCTCFVSFSGKYLS